MNENTGVSVENEEINSIDEIKKAAQIFTARHGSGVIELRVLMPNASPLSGFYDDLDKLAQDAVIEDAKGTPKGVYITLNPVNPELLSRSMNTLHKVKAGEATSDKDIIKRTWLLIDFDAKRKANTNATNAELEAAKDKALEVKQWMTDEGFPEPLIACSGNGYHLYYQLDLLNDEDSRNLIERFLKTLQAKFGDDKVDVDTSVSNASRITKLAGTTARKAPATDEQPQRKAFIVNKDYSPETDGIVSAELLRKIAPMEYKKVALQKTIQNLPVLKETSAVIGKLQTVQRNNTLTSLAGSMRQRGMDSGAIYAALKVTSDTKFSIPLEDDEIWRIAKGIERYEPARNIVTAIARNPTDLVNDVVEAIPFDSLVDAPLTDTGNAECFALEYGDNYRYNRDNNKWYFWNSVVWKEDKTDSINTAILKTVRDRQRVVTAVIDDINTKGKMLNQLAKCENVPIRLNIRKAAEWLPQLRTMIDQYDRDNYLVATQNGTLNLRDNSFYQSRQEDYLTKQLGAYYDKSAASPRWEQFLNEVFNGDAEMIDFVQRLIGYALTGDISEQKMFILYGYGMNGKSVFINTIQALLGDYAGTATFRTFDADKQSEQTNDLAALKGARFVAMSESAADRRINEPLIKQVTGGDKISCRFLRQEYFEYTPQFKLFLATNHKPVITQSDLGIWRRIALIPFTQSFKGREDKHLESKLLAELSGILNWALEGLKKWREDGLKLPKAVEDANQKYRTESDTVQQWLDTRTKQITGGIIKSSNAYGSYKGFCEENGYSPVSMRTLKTALEEKGFKSIRRSDANYFDGLELLPTKI